MYIGHFDGASRGNPGQAAIGCVLIDPDGETIWEHSELIGMATNNEAEYVALKRLLENALKLNIKAISVYGDSQLVINQVLGNWKINHSHLFALCQDARKLLDSFEDSRLSWVPREKNQHADKLSNLAYQANQSNHTRQFTGKTKKVDDNIYIVYGTELYAVDILHQACTCPSFSKGNNRPCKHLAAINNMLN